MRYISIASIKKAAAVIEADGKMVTLDSLSKQLNAKTSTVRHYLNNVQGLRDEISCTARARRKADQYGLVVDLMVSRGILITRKRLASLMGCSEQAVGFWFIRHRPKGVEVLSKTRLRRLHALSSIRWIYKIHGPVSRYRVAQLIGRDRGWVNRLIQEHPEVMKGL